MPRAEVGTTKWLANKMKAKGLQRLRWYCQMCEKQCRDENGFKCHRMSEGHQRQMQVFMQRANRYMDDFSREFEATFMQLMRTRYCRTRVLANTVYCELIADKAHIHMNATRWSTLSEFVLYLKRAEKCTAEYTDQGWYIEYIDREKIDREKREEAQRKNELSSEQRRERILKQKIKDAWKNKEHEDTIADEQIRPFERDAAEGSDEAAPITIQLPFKSTRLAETSSRAPPLPTAELFQLEVVTNAQEPGSPKLSSKNVSALERLINENEQRKRVNRGTKRVALDTAVPPVSSDSSSEASKPAAPQASSTVPPSPKEFTLDDEPWLLKGIIVRVTAEKFANGRYFRAKGLVEEVRDKYVGKIFLLESQDVVLLDQAMLEPVVPAVGAPILIIRGKYKERRGRVLHIDLVSTTAEVELSSCSGEAKGEGAFKPELLRFHFYDICKLQPS